MRVLILGGTAEARALAAQLAALDIDVVSSLAGRVARPALPVGGVRVGGFGGPAGLADYLQAESIDILLDATHPFAAVISANAHVAATAAGLPLLRLARPGWADLPDAPRWTWVDNAGQAAEQAAHLGRRTFLTSGRLTLSAFTSVAALAGRYTLVRLVDPPTDPLPEAWEVLVARGPYDLPTELQVISDRGIDVLVTKDSGGELTRAKLDAAGQLGVPVVVIRRPTWPGQDQRDTVSTVAAAVDWVRRPAGG